MKYADDIVRQMEERGEVKIPEDCFADESFEKHLHRQHTEPKQN